MKSNEIFKKLKKEGCYFIRQGKGSHEIWHSPITGQSMAIANHGSDEVAKGMEKKILKTMLNK